MNQPSVGAFNVLKPISLRVFFFRGTTGSKRVLEAFKKSYGLEKEPELQKEPIQLSEDLTVNFKYFEVNGQRFYTFLIGGNNDDIADKDALLRYGGGIYDLVSAKKSGAIIYVDHEAVPLFLKFGGGRFDKFYPILLHSAEDVEKYIDSKIFGQDEKELLFRMLQIQAYIENNVTARGSFKQKAKPRRNNSNHSEEEEDQEDRPPRRDEGHREVRTERKPKNRTPAKQFNPRNKYREESREEVKSRPKQKGWNRQRDNDSDERIPSPRRDSSSDDEDFALLKAKLAYLEAKAKKSNK